jgi:hypothetical protein
MAEENSLRSAVDRILGQPPGGGATSAGTGQGPMQLAAPAMASMNWQDMLGTTVGVSNKLPPPGSSPEEKELAMIRAQTAALQQQTASLLKTPAPPPAALAPLPLPAMPAPAPMPAMPAAPAAAPRPATSYSVGGQLTTTTPSSRAAAAAAAAPAPAPVPANPLTAPTGTPAQVVTVGSSQVYNPTTGTYVR